MTIARIAVAKVQPGHIMDGIPVRQVEREDGRVTVHSAGSVTTGASTAVVTIDSDAPVRAVRADELTEHHAIYIEHHFVGVSSIEYTGNRLRMVTDDDLATNVRAGTLITTIDIGSI